MRMIEASYKENAVFGRSNIERVRRIINSRGEADKLAEIPPSFIVMDLTWRCNYNCVLCIDKEAVNKEKKDLPVEIIEDVFDYSNKHNVRGIMTMGGEVFLHRESIKKSLEKSIEYNIPLKTVTNGSLLYNCIELVEEAYKIPGSILRVSINADKLHYKQQTGSNIKLEGILDALNRITSGGTPISVSTVVFSEESEKDGAIPNINSLGEINGYCKEAGVSSHILLPARNHLLREKYHLTENEKIVLEEIKNKGYAVKIDFKDFCDDLNYKEDDGEKYNQNQNFCPCPSGFIFTLIGSNGKIYKCTDNRGRECAILGEIKKAGDFETFWHSQERVEKQKNTSCQNKECARYRVNVLLDAAIKTAIEHPIINLVDYFEQAGGEDKIFI